MTVTIFSTTCPARAHLQGSFQFHILSLTGLSRGLTVKVTPGWKCDVILDGGTPAKEVLVGSLTVEKHYQEPTEPLGESGNPVHQFHHLLQID